MKFSYNLGDLYMDDELHPVFKEVMGLLRPDAYLTTTKMLVTDVLNVYKHAAELGGQGRQTLDFPRSRYDHLAILQPEK
jgi:hypothetical protein